MHFLPDSFDFSAKKYFTVGKTVLFYKLLTNKKFYFKINIFIGKYNNTKERILIIVFSNMDGSKKH